MSFKEDEKENNILIKKIGFPFHKKKINKSFINDDDVDYIYCNNENINLKKINEEIIKKLELYEKENIELKNIIEQLNQELNYKDKCLEECDKIIFELKNNYENEYNTKEKELKENEDDIISQKYERKNEIEEYKRENNELRNKLNKLKLDYNEKTKQLKSLSETISKTKNNINYIEMLKERERKIEEDELKIKNLIKENNSKEEQINLLTKYKKEEIPIYNKDISCNNYIINIFPIEEIFNTEILENKILNNGKINFKLEEALKDILYIPNKEKKYLTKEYLIDMNFKTELIKTECFSNYIREFNLYHLINNNNNEINNINAIIEKINIIKNKYNNILLEKEILLKENLKLKDKINDMNLYIIKIKEELNDINRNIKLKMNHIITLYEIKINQIMKIKDINLSIDYINSINIKSIYNNKIKDIKKEKPCLNIIKKENERLKNELAILIKDINEQQKEISNKKKLKYNFYYLNKNIFSISDYMKYSLIYELNNTKQILNVFKIIINNTKNKKNIFNEIIQNFLIVIEKINSINKNENNEDLKEAFGIFVERCNFDLDINILNENEIFIRKLIVKLIEINVFC